MIETEVTVEDDPEREEEQTIDELEEGEGEALTPAGRDGDD